LRKAGDALAKMLGPVDDFYDVWSGYGWRLGFYNQFELDESIAELPTTVMRVMLASDALEVTTENETYTLLIVWLLQSPHIKIDDRFPLFKKMIDVLRFEHSTPDYVLNVISHCPFLMAEDHDDKVTRKIMRKALSRRHADPALLRKAGLSSSAKNRGTGTLVDLSVQHPFFDRAFPQAGRALYGNPWTRKWVSSSVQNRPPA